MLLTKLQGSKACVGSTNVTKKKELEVTIVQQVSARYAEINDRKKDFGKEKTRYLKEEVSSLRTNGRTKT